MDLLTLGNSNLKGREQEHNAALFNLHFVYIFVLTFCVGFFEKQIRLPGKITVIYECLLPAVTAF